MAVIYGINAVGEALKARGRAFEYVAVARERHDQRVQRIIAGCRAQSIAVRSTPREELDRLAGGPSHQGVVAVTSEKQYAADADDLLASRRGNHAFLVVLDGVEDPHNLGAIIRTANAAGADGIVIPERRAVGVTGTVAKASAGASEHLPIAKVTNISRTLEELKKKNVWTVGLDERGDQMYDEVDYNMDCALVLGAEGKGLHEQVRKHCDFVVKIPTMGQVPSLNVSVAAGVVMYEVARQRRRRSVAEDAEDAEETKK
jgi:23S rRNA (guanosine2251-2'-O)-methyltransferase